MTAHSSKLPGCKLIRLPRRVDREVCISWRRKPLPQGAKAKCGTAEVQGRLLILP